MSIQVKISRKPLDYNETIKKLDKRVNDVINKKKPELLWILEHKSTYTAGTSYKSNEILSKKIHVIKTSRGGRVTYHGPGQRIVYFVLDLNNKKKDIRKFIIKIEKCIIETLKEYKIKSFNDRENIGIWIKKRNKSYKVAAIGIRIRKWVAFHGCSINVSTDLSYYKNIIPCGIKNKYITNLISIKNQQYHDLNKIIIKNFKKFLF